MVTNTHLRAPTGSNLSNNTFGGHGQLNISQNYSSAKGGRQTILEKDKQVLPLNWLLGHTEVPGCNGITRVVSIKTSRGVLRKPVTGICVLPKETTVKYLY